MRPKPPRKRAPKGKRLAVVKEDGDTEEESLKDGADAGVDLRDLPLEPCALCEAHSTSGISWACSKRKKLSDGQYSFEHFGNACSDCYEWFHSTFPGDECSLHTQLVVPGRDCKVRSAHAVWKGVKKVKGKNNKVTFRKKRRVAVQRCWTVLNAKEMRSASGAKRLTRAYLRQFPTMKIETEQDSSKMETVYCFKGRNDNHRVVLLENHLQAELVTTKLGKDERLYDNQASEVHEREIEHSNKSTGAHIALPKILAVTFKSLEDAGLNVEKGRKPKLDGEESPSENSGESVAVEELDGPESGAEWTWPASSRVSPRKPRVALAEQAVGAVLPRAVLQSSPRNKSEAARSLHGLSASLGRPSCASSVLSKSAEPAGDNDLSDNDDSSDDEPCADWSTKWKKVLLGDVAAGLIDGRTILGMKRRHRTLQKKMGDAGDARNLNEYIGLVNVMNDLRENILHLSVTNLDKIKKVLEESGTVVHEQTCLLMLNYTLIDCKKHKQIPQMMLRTLPCDDDDIANRKFDLFDPYLSATKLNLKKQLKECHQIWVVELVEQEILQSHPTTAMELLNNMKTMVDFLDNGEEVDIVVLPRKVVQLITHLSTGLSACIACLSNYICISFSEDVQSLVDAMAQPLQSTPLSIIAHAVSKTSWFHSLVKHFSESIPALQEYNEQISRLQDLMELDCLSTAGFQEFIVLLKQVPVWVRGLGPPGRLDYFTDRLLEFITELWSKNKQEHAATPAVDLEVFNSSWKEVVSFSTRIWPLNDQVHKLAEDVGQVGQLALSNCQLSQTNEAMKNLSDALKGQADDAEVLKCVDSLDEVFEVADEISEETAPENAHHIKALLNDLFVKQCEWVEQPSFASLQKVASYMEGVDSEYVKLSESYASLHAAITQERGAVPLPSADGPAVNLDESMLPVASAQRKCDTAIGQWSIGKAHLIKIGRDDLAKECQRLLDEVSSEQKARCETMRSYLADVRSKAKEDLAAIAAGKPGGEHWLHGEKASSLQELLELHAAVAKVVSAKEVVKRLDLLTAACKSEKDFLQQTGLKPDAEVEKDCNQLVLTGKVTKAEFLCMHWMSAKIEKADLREKLSAEIKEFRKQLPNTETEKKHLHKEVYKHAKEGLKA